MRWWGRRVEQQPGTDVNAHAQRAEDALYKARADEPRVAALADEISQKMRENQWSPKIAAAFRAPPKAARDGGSP